MTIPRITSLLIMLALGCDAVALQLGQISAQSQRGAPLAARITLYGTMPIDDDAVAVEIMAAFGAPQDALAALGVNARLMTESNGATYIAITSGAAINTAQIALRVRLKGKTSTMVRRYDVMLATPPAAHLAPTSAHRRRISLGVSAVDLTAQTGAYGPVRAGQSLWSIVRETGLASAPSAALMAGIVAANPGAFVAGDATRLRLGVMLHLPAAGSTATVTSNTMRNTDPSSEDAQLRARLDRLGTKFALLRARYVEQQQSRPTRSDLAPKTTTPQPTARATVVPSKAVPASVAAGASSPLGALGNDVDGKTLMGMGGAALTIALLLLGTRLGRHLRGRHTARGVRNADRSLVAEIARKTEKRIQLESEVKRTIAARRDAAADIDARIAHGQYQDAETLLEEVIAATPANHRAKLQLAEIYYLNQRHAEFVALSDEIQRQHRREIGDDNWARLMRMGKVIAPNHPPFSGPVAVEERRAS